MTKLIDDQEFMTKLIELRDDGQIQVAFDRAGTSTSASQGTLMFDIATAMVKREQHERVWMRIIEAMKWFHAYKQMVKMALQQIQTANLQHYLDVICIPSDSSDSSARWRCRRCARCRGSGCWAFKKTSSRRCPRASGSSRSSIC